MKSKLLWRNNKYKEANLILSAINFENISQIRKKDFFQLKGKLLEKFKKFDAAYECFSKVNLLTKESKEYSNLDPEKYFENLENNLDKMRARLQNKLRPIQTSNEGFNPTFLIGFPRSGTTLLDAILRSHSKIDVVEEKPLLDTVEEFLVKNGFRDFAGKVIPPDLNSAAQKIYEVEFKKYIEAGIFGSICIDKLPLNLLKVDLIYQLYPNAKFILALRHPMDTIFSCWIQNFKLNPAMANMVDLDRIADFYCFAMEIFKICRTNYNLSIHEIDMKI